ncbi:cell division protein FtsA [Buchnera aphidicola]|uniref:cell division protein FtsA n=1 Tax=Buchnera aphidicola TaxID=9 RepID=UPI00223758C8|nr:cell division protein FtsA [Buchnera aphidicola]MCW5197762.1 cell division protein FtsA [Buchnera aphidicola (Chaitophorus viminalis)]
MIKSKNKKLIVGLEIGTTKVTVLVGEKINNKEIKVIGVGNCPSKGIDKGNIQDLESMVKCIKKSIYQAEKMSDQKIYSVNLSFSNKYIQYKNEIGMVSINTGEVTKEDIKNVINTAKSVRMNDKYHILHVIPQEYIIDEQKGIKNPLGLSGIRMQAKVHLITSYYNIEKNIVKAVKKCNLEVNKIIFSGLASSQAILTEEEKKLGVCILDIGGGTIDLLIYIDGSLQHSQVIPYAGNIITKDISYAFSISMSDAEYLKIKYGCASSFLQENLQKIEIKRSKDHKSQTFNQEKLIEVIELRCLELLEIINTTILKLQKKFKKHNSKYNFNAGIIITGGVSKTKFFLDCAERVFQMKVRIGRIKNINGLENNINQPEYSTVIGLLNFQNQKYSLENNFSYNTKKQNWLSQIKNFFKF